MKEITLPAVTGNITRVTAFVDAQLEAWECPMKAQMQIDVAVDEIFANIARYAYAPETGDVSVRLAFDADTRTVSITFLDRGIPFDPLARTDPDVNAPPEERGIGGLGIFLVKKMMDRVDYRYADGRNILTVQKRI